MLLPRTGETNSDLAVAFSNFKFSNFKFVTRASRRSNVCADPLVQSGRALHDLRPLRLSERQRRHGCTLCAAPPPGTRCLAVCLRRARTCGACWRVCVPFWLVGAAGGPCWHGGKGACVCLFGLLARVCAFLACGNSWWVFLAWRQGI